jgi:hypothetical protein
VNPRKLLGIVSCAILALATSFAVALDQHDPPLYRLLDASEKDSPPSFSETAVDRSQPTDHDDAGSWQSYRCPRWTAAADFIILDRVGNANQTLVERVPLHDDPYTITGVEALSSNDFQQGFAAGPRLDLIRHGDRGYDFELSYFQIDGWSSDRSVGPDNPIDWLVMRAPGGFTQTNQPPRLATQAMVWDYATKLYNAELNVRWNPYRRVTMLAGFRWMNLGENLVGTLNPTTFPSEQSYWNFWNATTTNNLYGFQIGADGKLWEHGRFSINGLVKGGIFDNNAEQTTEVSVIAKQQRTASASTNHAAFVGETGLQCKYQLGERLLLRAGYEALWLQGVALAPGQIQETYTTASPIAVQVIGVNFNSGVFYHGATAGVEYSF